MLEHLQGALTNLLTSPEILRNINFGLFNNYRNTNLTMTNFLKSRITVSKGSYIFLA